MKYLKMLGLMAIALVALTAFASPASATTLTSPAGTHLPVGTTIHAVSKGHVVLDSAIGKIECNSTLEGNTTTTGGLFKEKTTDVEMANSSLSFTGCTTALVKVLKPGTLTINSGGGGNGTLVSNGAEVTVETFGVHCIFATSGNTIGTVTGGNPAVIEISATIPRTGGGGGVFCGSSAPWTGSYEVTKPKPLVID